MLGAMKVRRRPRHPRQAGLTLVGLLVGIAIGLVLITGATRLLLANLDSSRRLLLQARLNQNLRSAAELITRDLRRAGHWDRAVQEIGSGASNHHQDISHTASSIAYAFTAPGGAAGSVQFSLSDRQLRMKIGDGTAQALTDPLMARVTGFEIIENQSEVDLGAQRIPAAAPGTHCLRVRRYDIRIEAEAPTYASVKRRLQTAVRVRNDRVGDCAA